VTANVPTAELISVASPLVVEALQVYVGPQINLVVPLTVADPQQSVAGHDFG
jgi:hypothetical protein